MYIKMKWRNNPFSTFANNLSLHTNMDSSIVWNGFCYSLECFLFWFLSHKVSEKTIVLISYSARNPG